MRPEELNFASHAHYNIQRHGSLKLFCYEMFGWKMLDAGEIEEAFGGPVVVNDGARIVAFNDVE